MEKSNFFTFSALKKDGPEVFESIIKKDDLLIERIISSGQITPAGEWYDQEQDEWVILLEGKATIRFEEQKLITLEKGDYLLIPAHCRHRVEYTQFDPPCVWLAIHGKLMS